MRRAVEHEREVAGASRPRGRIRQRLLFAAAVALWLWSTFAHRFGTDVARSFFTWSQTEGNLHEDGGRAGMASAEALLAAGFVAIVACVLGLVVWRLRTLDAATRRDRLVTWALWGCFLYLIWRTVIVYTTELVHFAQYGLICAVLCAAIDRGRRPEVAFLIACGMGALDEAWQHWGLALWIEENLRHGFDWSDLILNATGACGGALVFVSGARGEDTETRSRRVVYRATAALALVLLPLLLLSRTTLAAIFGTYYYHPFWNELENGKPVHWMTPIDGIPLVVASVLFLGLLIASGRAMIGRGAALALLALVTISIQPPSRLEGRPVHEVVSRGTAQRVPTGSIRIDGVLDEAAWDAADTLGPFVNAVTGKTWLPLPDGTRGELARTEARMAWDDEFLYVAFELADEDVWARPTERDDPTLPGDEVVEVFVDPDGDEVTYYEFEFSSLNVHYDLFNVIPEPPMDYNPSSTFLGLADWDARGVRSAVSVHGTLDRVESWEPTDARDTDEGWSVEIAIPWSVFRTTTTPHRASVKPLPPKVGDTWRFGLYRVERPRIDPGNGAELSRKEARPYAQLQAWSPANMNSFHKPDRFGVIEFVDER